VPIFYGEDAKERESIMIPQGYPLFAVVKTGKDTGVAFVGAVIGWNEDTDWPVVARLTGAVKPASQVSFHLLGLFTNERDARVFANQWEQEQ
jgi:hypothetical protein